MAKPFSDETSVRYQRCLERHPDALAFLKDEWRISRDIIERFKIGLSKPYQQNGSTEHANALVAPLLNEQGRFCTPYTYVALPGITIDNRLEPPRSWCPSAQTYYARGFRTGDSVLLCPTVEEVWSLSGAIAGTSLEKELVLIAPTPHPSGWPGEWKAPKFWARWVTIFIAINGSNWSRVLNRQEADGSARDLARLIGRDIRRVACPNAEGWRAACVEGMREQQLRQALQRAPAITPADLRALELDQLESSQAFDLSSSYCDGQLYETVRVLENSQEGGSPAQRFATLVIRSDRTLHRQEQLRHPKGTPPSERVSRLVPDGRLLKRDIQGNPYGTWRWSSAKAFLLGKTRPQNLGALLDLIYGHLRACVWLPRQADYALLANCVVVTYCQQIFDAVPLIFVTGDKGSGKSKLGSTMRDLCANSTSTGSETSAATLMRLIDMSRGFVVIDDLEKIRGGKNGEPSYGSLIQALKLSYKKSTAEKYWTDANEDMRVKCLNFFGVKMINNTQGADEILSSRMVVVHTRTKPERHDPPGVDPLDAEALASLRDALHTWAFENVSRIAQTYAQLAPNPGSRAEEISAPLRVVAALGDRPQFTLDLERALDWRPGSDAQTPRQIMEEAISEILRDAIQNAQALRLNLTVFEVGLRMRLLAGSDFGRTRTTDISEIQSPEWIGAQFANWAAATGSSPTRFQMHAHGMRAWQLDDRLINQALEGTGIARQSLRDEDNPRAFCRVCRDCDYQGICALEAKKQRADQRDQSRGRNPPARQ